MGTRMAILWGTIHEEIDRLDDKRLEPLLAELNEDAVQYFPDFVCRSPIDRQDTVSIVSENIKFLGGENSDILVRNLFRRLQDSPLEPNPMSPVARASNAFDSLVTNGCSVDDVALYLIRVLKKATESDAINSFKYALGTFVDFLLKYKHRKLFNTFVEYLEFYIHQKPNGMEYDKLVYLVGLQSECQEEQDWVSHLHLSKVINDCKAILRQPGVSVKSIPTYSGYNGEESLANRYVQLLFVQDYTDFPTLLLLLVKLREFICTLDLARRSPLLYAAVHQLVNFLNYYKKLMLSDDFDKIRDVVGLISTSIKQRYPDISQKLDLFIK